MGPQAPGLVPWDYTCDLLHNGGVERSVAPMAAQSARKQVSWQIQNKNMFCWT